MSKAQVFIVESLDVEDEEKRREGEVLFRALQMMGKKPIYRYIRTITELDHFIDEFEDSEYRYLHLSCHGSRTGVKTTFDDISTAKFAEMLGTVLDGRRLFLSACQAATMDLAEQIFKASTCYSIVGPRNKIYFDDSVVFWTSFYHLMFKHDTASMKLAAIKASLETSAALTGDQINLYNRTNEGVAVHTQLGPKIRSRRKSEA